MIAHIKMIERIFECINKLGIAVAQIISAAIQMQINQPPAIHIINEIALAFVDDQINASLGPEFGFLGIPIFDRFLDHLRLGRKFEPTIIKHQNLPARITSALNFKLKPKLA